MNELSPVNLEADEIMGEKSYRNVTVLLFDVSRNYRPLPKSYKCLPNVIEAKQIGDKNRYGDNRWSRSKVSL